MTPSQLWYAAAVLLFVLEIITPGFVLAPLALGALAAGIGAELGAALQWQLGLFVLGTGVGFVVVRPLLRRARPSSDTDEHGQTDALLGRVAVVTQLITSDGVHGEVQVDTIQWRAVSRRATALHPGTKVRICGVESTTLVVEEVE
jgi:membrane protein implicated in regulation of membrane protease activity